MVPAGSTPTLDVVICTHDNAGSLDVALDALGRQQADAGWRVVVIDNACTDHTAAVVEAHRARQAIPSLVRIDEPRLGLTSARLRGARETSSPWLAFVDDDCVVDPGWVTTARSFAAAHPEIGGFGGRVIPTYERPDPLLDRIGWAFAQQDHGADACEVDSIVGAGMVLRRAALDASGWTAQPLLADRTGQRLTSGGDVEIAQRIRAAGGALWFVPGMTIEHRISAARTTPAKLRPLVFGLGVCESRVTALTWPGGRLGWVRRLRGLAADSATRAARGARRARRRRELRPFVLEMAYEAGRWVGAAAVLTTIVRGRPTAFGVAAVRSGTPT